MTNQEKQQASEYAREGRENKLCDLIEGLHESDNGVYWLPDETCTEDLDYAVAQWRDY